MCIVNVQDDISYLRLISVIWIVCEFIMVVGNTVTLNRALLQSGDVCGVMIILVWQNYGWRVGWRLVLHQVKQKTVNTTKQTYKLLCIRFSIHCRGYPHYGPNLANMARNPRHSSNNLWLSPLHMVWGFGKWCHPVVQIIKFFISITIYYVPVIYRHTYKWLTRWSFRYE